MVEHLNGSIRAGSRFDISISKSRHTQTQNDIDN